MSDPNASGAGSNVPGEAEAEFFVFEKFGSLNTKANRPAIKDEEFSWVQNFMPIGDGNLRTLWAEGVAIYTAPGGRTIINVVYYNLAPQPVPAISTSYAAVFLDNGTAVQVELSNGATTTINATAGLFYDTTTVPTASQWQALYLVIITTIAASPNSYFIWDGTNLYQAASVSPDVTVTNAGQDYTSAPTATAFGGSGSGATFAVTVENGAVTGVTVTDPGSGYLATDGIVQLAFTGGGSDTSAQATASVATTGGVAAVNITASGTDWTTTSVVTFSGGGGSGAQAVITGLVNGAVTEISVTNPGTGYTSAPTVAVSGGGGGGSGFAGEVDVRYGQVSGIAVGAGGSGYKDNPQVIISPPDSTSLPVLQATAIAVTSGGAVTSIIVTQAGLGYTKPPTVTLVGGNNAAAATINLMPFGIAGTAIETYQGSIWTINGPKVSFTAPGTTSNFATSAGGGSFVSNNNFLRAAYVSLKQTNGFLYLIGDSSIDVISNVQTTTLTVGGAVTVTTTFNNSNVDPQTGTPWRDSVTVFGRAIVFANPNGVYALYGGAAEKVSGPLDGLFANASFTTGASGVIPTSAVATLFGIRCYMLNFTTINPYTRLAETLLTAWDGAKWFAGSQINSMDIVGTSEASSLLTAYGATPTAIYPMLTTPNASLVKIGQTRLRSEPSLAFGKQANRLYLTAQTPSGSTPTVNVGIDTERGLGPQQAQEVAGAMTFTGAGGTITFVGTGPITFVASGLVALAWNYNYSGVYGTYIGLSFTTYAADLTILALGALYRPFQPRV